MNASYPVNRIVYANTEKQIPYILYARDHGINLTLFDNASELDKMAKYHPKSKLLIRIGVSLTMIKYRLSIVDNRSFDRLTTTMLRFRLVENLAPNFREFSIC